jgi:cytoskeletal protein CcmA (bactofilin family)
MALFKKDRGRTSEDVGEPASRPSPTASTGAPSVAPTETREREGTKNMASYAAGERMTSGDTSRETAFLGKGTRLSGKVSFEGTARIEGQIEGEIVANDTLLIGESALVNAQITGGTIVIHGKVTGDITASKKLEIRAPGRLYGNVTTPSLVIEEGVVFEGHCSMGATEARGDRKVTLLATDARSAESGPPPALKAQAEGK